MIEPITKLVTGIVHHEYWLPFNIRSESQRSRSQGHKMQKRIEGDLVAGVSYALYRVSSL